MSMDRLIERIIELKNPTVAGLDPKLDYIPDFIKEYVVAEYGNTMQAAAKALFQNLQSIFWGIAGQITGWQTCL